MVRWPALRARTLGRPYAIIQGSLTAGSNYNLSFIGANLEITPATLTVTADTKSKVYGNADPAPDLPGHRLPLLAAATVLSGGLSRAGGGARRGGPYAIGQGSLSRRQQLHLTFTGNLNNHPGPAHGHRRCPDKVYGQADPALTYKVTARSPARRHGPQRQSEPSGGRERGQPTPSARALAADSNYRTPRRGEPSRSRRPDHRRRRRQAKAYGQADPAWTYRSPAGHFAHGGQRRLTDGRTNYGRPVPGSLCDHRALWSGSDWAHRHSCSASLPTARPAHPAGRCQTKTYRVARLRPRLH